jgi:hypothetical protein
MSGNLNIPGNGSHLQGAPTPANSYVGGGMQAPAPASKPTVEDVDEESGEDDSAGVNPASLLAQVCLPSFMLGARMNAQQESLVRSASRGRVGGRPGPSGAGVV